VRQAHFAGCNSRFFLWLHALTTSERSASQTTADPYPPQRPGLPGEGERALAGGRSERCLLESVGRRWLSISATGRPDGLPLIWPRRVLSRCPAAAAEGSRSAPSTR